MRNIEFVRQIRFRNKNKWAEIKYQKKLLEYLYTLQKELENILDKKIYKKEYIDTIIYELERTKKDIGYSENILRYYKSISKINTSIG